MSENLTFLKVGDITILKDSETKKFLYFVGHDKMTANGVYTSILASDPKNKNTFSRFSEKYLNKKGYRTI